MFAFDTSIISLAIDDTRSVFIDPKTNKPVERPGDRVKHLLSSLAKDRATILLPTPVFSELLIFSKDAMEKLFQYLGDEVVFQFASFDEKAAVETARAMRERREYGIVGDSFEVNITRNKIKVDYQIVAIARTQGAKAIYSQDRHLNNHSKRCGLEVRTITDIELPPPNIQNNLGL